MQPIRRIDRRRALGLLSGGAVVSLLPACGWDGHFSILGYTTRPNYDLGIHTVRVPIFENRTFVQRLEFDLTQAIVREIEDKTPYKVVSYSSADTLLTGKITAFQKNILLENQLNEVREAETIMTVEVIWKDLRTGKFLSRPARLPGEPLPAEALADQARPGNPAAVTITPPAFPTTPEIAAANNNGPTEGAAGPGLLQPQTNATATPSAGPAPKPPGTIVLTSRGNFVPELGGSIASSKQLNVNRMAMQIVDMMEKPW